MAVLANPRRCRTEAWKRTSSSRGRASTSLLTAGAHVKLPGPSLREPNVYDFGTPYKQMFDDLRRKDPELYPFHLKLWGFFDCKKFEAFNLNECNLLILARVFDGVLHRAVKTAPQRWQDNAADGSFDVVFTFEEKVFDMVIKDLHNKNHTHMKTVLVINLEVKDNHEEAAIGARLTLELCQEIKELYDSVSLLVNIQKSEWSHVDVIHNGIIRRQRRQSRPSSLSVSFSANCSI
ncbi:hypothetical protein PIB30_063585 [Stylosanthes scabra]|uniref:RNA polymerase II subunit A C-terminal domain phosphatase SSU72 n=1 Tax=Stylosanthes scabra TaxID=79078 RepID=A0ABU6ZK81_9FABA|nr:hypothetical protein [Stylosanthes scabra]